MIPFAYRYLVAQWCIWCMTKEYSLSKSLFLSLPISLALSPYRWNKLSHWALLSLFTRDTNESVYSIKYYTLYSNSQRMYTIASLLNAFESNEIKEVQTKRNKIKPKDKNTKWMKKGNKEKCKNNFHLLIISGGSHIFDGKETIRSAK